LKTLQGNVGKTLKDVGRANDFLSRTPIAKEIRARIDEWGCIKLKSFCIKKETITNIKRQPAHWRKYLPVIQINNNYPGDIKS
jgi:hypothetical protein